PPRGSSSSVSACLAAGLTASSPPVSQRTALKVPVLNSLGLPSDFFSDFSSVLVDCLEEASAGFLSALGLAAFSDFLSSASLGFGCAGGLAILVSAVESEFISSINSARGLSLRDMVDVLPMRPGMASADGLPHEGWVQSKDDASGSTTGSEL